MPLSGILHEKRTERELLRHFKHLCYYRRAAITKQGQKPFPEAVIWREQSRGFKTRGAFRKRVRCFTNGLVLGAELFVL